MNDITSTATTTAPPVQWVFVHGAAGSSSFWDLVRPAFPAAWAVDLPGHAAGRARRTEPSPATSEPILESIDAFADWLMGEIAARQWGEVVLVGHSMGGAIAQVVALRRPAWLRGVVLSSTGPILPVPDELIDWSNATTRRQLIGSWRTASPRRPPATGARASAASYYAIPPALTLADYRACNAFDIRAALEQAQWTIPTVIVCGEGDQMTPPAYSEFLAAHMARAQLGLIETRGPYGARWSNPRPG